MPKLSEKTGWRLAPRLVLLLAIMIAVYVHRFNITLAAEHLMAAYRLDLVQMGQLFSAFQIGYTLFQIPGGRLADSWGPEKTLAAALAVWSAFTVLTGMVADAAVALAWSPLVVLVATRFLLGVGQAAALPAANRFIAETLTVSRRGIGNSLFLSGVGVSLTLGPPLVAWMILKVGWRGSFYLAGFAGMALAAVWFGVTRDRSRPSGNRSGLVPSRRAPAPWRAILHHRGIWFLAWSYFCWGYLTNVFGYWLYLYLAKNYGVTGVRGASLTAIPYATTLLGTLGGGLLSDFLVRRAGLRWGRSGLALAGITAGGAFLHFGAAAGRLHLAVGLFAVATALIYLAFSVYWASATDLAREHTATVSGMMNTGGNLGGTLSPALTPWIAQQWGWVAALDAAVVMALLAALLWIWVNPTLPLHATGSISSPSK